MKRSSDSLQTAIRAALGSLTAVAGATAPLHAIAQEPNDPDELQPVVEEVVVVGRFLSATEQLVNERLDDANVSDILGSESIGRLGDSTVADALRRMPGLTLVADKFVYVRGLGERYSTATLNGAQIPSPDLTRNVIPLDVFPTSIVDSLRVQKAWSADLSANFGGGLMEIRTKGIPDGLELNFEIGSAYNTENTGSGFTYPGGSDDNFGTDDGTRALSPLILAGVNEYQGMLDTQNILSFLRRQSVSTTLADAQAVNRSFATALNRGAVAENKSMPADIDAKVSVGNTFNLNDNWDIGILAGASYATNWRKTTVLQRNFVFPEERTDTRSETTQSVNLSGNLNLGLNFTEDHEIALTHLWLRNTDDETEIRDYFNENRERSSGLGFRDYRFEFEEREMTVDQIRGTHYLGDATRDLLPRITGVLSWLPAETQLDWFYSESEAATDIPNRVVIQSQTNTHPATGAVLSEAVRLSNTAADHRFTDLKDEVRNNGVSLIIPIDGDNSRLELSGGFENAQKARTYQQLQFSIGPLSVADPAALMGPLDQVFSDANILSPENDFVFDRQGTNNESYLAATTTDSAWGNVDWIFNETWRLAVGARWEDYRQVGLDWDPLGFTQANPQVTTDVDVLTRSVFASDEVYPSAAFTYMSSFWAATFQLRLGLSQTAVRPDLREITDASYVDPITDILTRGNSGVVPSDVDNVDIRAEWFFDSGDNFTVTLFSKEIANPIEFFATAASDTTVARQILNAESGYVRGVEIEGMKRLGFIGPVFESLFVQGNATFQDSELTVGSATAGRVQPTHLVRPLAGASDYVLNLMLGYDSPNAKHTASLAYNVFSERLFTAGRNGQPDSFEQPFESLDLTYSWYPTDKLALKVKLQNILGETVQIEQQNVLVFDEDPGSTYKVAVQWRL